MSLTNKVIVITGGSSGMGAATAKLAVEAGAKVVIGARREADLQKVVAATQSENILYQVTDVTQPDQVKALINLAITNFGCLDVLYNNAGIMPQGNLIEAKTASWQKMLNINVMGVLNGIAAALPLMKEQGHGLIMATDSVAGHVLYPGSAVYNGSKFAVRAIMEGLRQEEHNNGIKTGIISPGAVRTNLLSTTEDDQIRDLYERSNQAPNGSLAAEDVARAAIFMMDQPEGVDINEILVRPTGQGI